LEFKKQKKLDGFSHENPILVLEVLNKFGSLIPLILLFTWGYYYFPFVIIFSVLFLLFFFLLLLLFSHCTYFFLVAITFVVLSKVGTNDYHCHHTHNT
jgi:hypothetical protein